VDVAEAILAMLMDPGAPNLDDDIAELIDRPSRHRDAAWREMETRCSSPTRRTRQ
jgi:hypothetical protein